ncbi:hypothetical protein DFH06DRAFT_986484, partial [Mycena polygramma]
MAARTSGKGKSSSSKYCLHHGQNPTHSSDECRNLKNLSQGAKKESKSRSKKPDKREKKSGSQANPSAASDSDSDDSEVDAKVAIASVSAKSYSAFSAYLSSDSGKPKWVIVIDSGASRVMTPHLDWFETGTYQTLNPPRKVRLGNDTHCDAIGIGSIWFSCKTKHGVTKLELKRALHVPSF